MLDGTIQNDIGYFENDIGYFEDDIGYFEDALVKQVTADTEAYLREKIQPQLDELIKEIAAQAVGKWSTKINVVNKMTDHGFTPITEVQVNFVEEVINKVHQENIIKVKVNK